MLETDISWHVIIYHLHVIKTGVLIYTKHIQTSLLSAREQQLCRYSSWISSITLSSMRRLLSSFQLFCMTSMFMVFSRLLFVVFFFWLVTQSSLVSICCNMLFWTSLSHAVLSQSDFIFRSLMNIFPLTKKKKVIYQHTWDSIYFSGKKLKI